MKKILYILLIGLNTLVFSQNNDLEKLTKDLYLMSDWDGLVKLSKRINADHFATYEMDYRLAVAYYYTGDYIDSASKFEHIINKYQIKNDLIKEYLYYSYLFSGRDQDALLVAKDFPFHLQVKTNTKKFRFINNIFAEGGLKLSNSTELGIDNLTYLNAGIGQQFGYKMKLLHTYTNLSQDYIDYNIKQKEYYAKISYQMGKGVTLIPSYHYANTLKEILTNNVGNTSNNNMGMNSSGSITTETDITSEEMNTSIFHLAIKKQWDRFFISPNIIYLTTNSNVEGIYNRMQYGVNAGYTLKSTHDKLWLGTGIDMLNNSYTTELIWNVKAYYGIGTKAYLYFRYFNAGTSDFILEDAMYYYNAVSTINDNFSATFGYHFSPKFLWYVNYQYENAEDTDYNLKFNYNTIITGIKIDL